MNIDIIAAVNNEYIIGLDQEGHSMPWPNLKQDMLFFRNVTTNTPDNKINAIIVGHTTWNTLPALYKRNSCIHNFVLSRHKTGSEHNATYVHSWTAAVKMIDSMPNVNRIIVIGGSQIYRMALASNRLGYLYLTHIDISCSRYINGGFAAVYFPLRQAELSKLLDTGALAKISCHTHVQGDINYNIVTYQATKETLDIPLDIPLTSYQPNRTITTYDEWQLYDLIKKIKNCGIYQNTRNGPVFSLYGCSLRYDLQKGFPLTTLKKSYPKSVFEELMWIIRGQTDVAILRSKGVNIWNANSSKEFLQQNGLSYQEGDIGPGYGFQLRHFGAEYIDCHTDYTGQGTDQLAYVIDLLRHCPTSRRMVISLWNPTNTDKMALPPCHVMYTFNVELYQEPIDGMRGKLHCHLNQRSWDVFLGWNTTTAALLTHLLAAHTGYHVGTLFHSISNAHIYQSHITCGAIDTLLKRTPRTPPILKITAAHDNIEDYQYYDIELSGYVPNGPISATMVA